MIQHPSIKSMKNNIIKNKTPNSQKSRTITFCVINSFTNYLKNIVTLPLLSLSLSFSSLSSLTFLNNVVQKPFGWTKQDSHPHSGREVTAAWYGGLEPKRESNGICATKCPRTKKRKEDLHTESHPRVGWKGLKRDESIYSEDSREDDLMFRAWMKWVEFLCHHSLSITSVVNNRPLLLLGLQDALQK